MFTYSLHASGLHVVRSMVNMIDVYDLYCHLHTSVRVMTYKHLRRGEEEGEGEEEKEGERERGGERWNKEEKEERMKEKKDWKEEKE